MCTTHYCPSVTVLLFCSLCFCVYCDFSFCFCLSKCWIRMSIVIIIRRLSPSCLFILSCSFRSLVYCTVLCSLTSRDKWRCIFRPKPKLDLSAKLKHHSCSATTAICRRQLSGWSRLGRMSLKMSRRCLGDAASNARWLLVVRQQTFKTSVSSTDNSSWRRARYASKPWLTSGVENRTSLGSWRPGSIDSRTGAELLCTEQKLL